MATESGEGQARNGSARAPLHDVRVLDLSIERSGALCAMLLCDLGADVVRVETVDGRHRRPDPRIEAGPLCWDRGKRVALTDGLDPTTDPQMARMLSMADVVVVDDSPQRLDRVGLSPQRLADLAPGAVVSWLPSNGSSGPLAELPADPLLLSAVSGYAQLQPTVAGVPIAPVVPVCSNIQAGIGAAGTIAALIERRRSGIGQVVAVTGLHAANALVCTMAPESIDDPNVVRTGRDVRRMPSFRIYRCGDGEWIFLGGLVSSLFVAALDAMDLLDPFLAPGIEGEFMNLFVGDNGVQMSTALDARFAQMPRAHWLEVLSRAGVPAAPVSRREEWVASEAFAAVGGRVERRHLDLGPVLMPSVPITFSTSSCAPGEIPDRCEPAAQVWTDAPARLVPSEVASTDIALLTAPPLAGVRVLDTSTFLAGPMCPLLLELWGAEVIKVESPRGDPYRTFTMSFAAVNQGKRSVVLDMGTAAGMSTFIDLVRDADVVMDNLRASSRMRMGLTYEAIAAVNPSVVHCTVSAFGDDGPMAEAPGFDPVVQAYSGFMYASGDGREPFYSATPVHDVAAGVLSAVGTLAALYARDEIGHGQRVTVSLASSSMLLQAEEFTTFAGRAPTALGGQDFTGPSVMHRYHRSADGWVALCARTDEEIDAVRRWCALLEPMNTDAAVFEAAVDAAISSAMASRSTADIIEELRALGVAAARVLDGDDRSSDPHLAAHHLFHIVDDPGIGRYRVMNTAALWSRSPLPEPAWSARLGEHEPRWSD